MQNAHNVSHLWTHKTWAFHEIIAQLSCCLEMIINENARPMRRVFYDDNFQYFSDRKTSLFSAFLLKNFKFFLSSVACKRSCWIFFLMNSIKVFDLRQCLILVSPRSSCKSIPVNPFISLALCIATIVSFLWWCHASNGLLPLCQPIIIKSLMKCVKLILWLFLTAAGGWQKSNAFVIRTF